MLLRNPVDTPEGISKATLSLARVFSGLLSGVEDQGAFVSKFQKSIEITLKELDEKMRAATRDEKDIAEWARRMRECEAKMDILRKKPRGGSEEIVVAMGYLRAVIEGTEMTLMLNRPAA